MRDTWAQGTPLYLPISLHFRMKSELWKLLEPWEEVLGFLKVSMSQVALSATLPAVPARFCSTKARPIWRAAWEEGLQQVSRSGFYRWLLTNQEGGGAERMGLWNHSLWGPLPLPILFLGGW